MAAEASNDSDKPDAKLQGYLDAITKYERAFEKWEKRSGDIIKRYRDDGREGAALSASSAKFNILWSNVQTLVPACFARVPQPDVSRRFRDQDPVGRVGALMLERGLEFEVQHYPDYRETMTQCVHDRFLGGRGTCWVRYEPHFKDAGDAQVTEDVQDAPVEEQLDYECAPVDYVHWKDFGHSVARTWEEVTCVWRKVYMSEEAVTERFGEEIAKRVPYDSTPDDLKAYDKGAQQNLKQQACIIELWDKEAGVAVWLSKSMKEVIEELPDPLKLQDFFPTPKPLYATLTNETLVPVPDFVLYQDQAYTLDTLADRAAGLVQMLQLKGVYDGSADASLGRLFTEGSNGNLLPVKNWAAFAEKNGLAGQVDVVDLTPIAKALEACYLAAEQQKQQVYEIMGISDIVRGTSDPNETLGAQELKGQYASMRLRAMQADVARFATDVLRIKAQIMCSKFNPATLAAIAAVEQLQPEDQQVVYLFEPPAPPQIDPMTGQPMPPAPPQPVLGPDGKPVPHGPAMVLLVGEARIADPEGDSPNPLRSFRIDVNSDSMVQMDEAKDKEEKMEMLTAFGGYMKQSAEVGAVAPQMIPLLVEVGKFGLTAFKAGKGIEGTFDTALEQLKQLAQNPPPPPPDPAMVKAEADIEGDKQRLELEKQSHAEDRQFEREKHEDEKVFRREEQDDKRQSAQEDRSMKREQMDFDKTQQTEQANFDRDQAGKKLESDERVGMAKVEAGKKPTTEVKFDANDEIGKVGKNLEAMHSQQSDALSQAAQVLAQAAQMMAQAMQELTKAAQQMGGPKRHVRGADGRITHTVPEALN